MTNRNYDEDQDQPASTRRLHAILQPHTTRQRMAFLFSALALGGLGTLPFWIPSSSSDNEEATYRPSETPSEQRKQEASMDASAQTAKENQGNMSNSSSTSLRVNGETIPLPSNGSYHKTTTDGNGQTSLDVNVSNNSDGATNNSSTSIDLHSSSHSSITNNTR